jgi:hypothetical protein
MLRICSARGVAAEAARRIARNFDADRIEQQIDSIQYVHYGLHIACDHRITSFLDAFFQGSNCLPKPFVLILCAPGAASAGHEPVFQNPVSLLIGTRTLQRLRHCNELRTPKATVLIVSSDNQFGS